MNNEDKWKMAPAWANWLAQDADGTWWWYENKPVWDEWWMYEGRVSVLDIYREHPSQTLEGRP
jgi:hypothetical protein